MALFKYMTIANLLHLLDGHVRFTQPGAFNDPFEMLPHLRFPPELDDQDTKPSFDLTSGQQRTRTCDTRETFDDANSRRLVHGLSKTVGIYCTSRNGSSLTMWAHYADSYRGALVEFDENHDFFAGKVEMDYQTVRPVCDISGYLAAGRSIPIAELCVKPLEWSYESEVRIVRPLADCTVVGDPDAVFPVYIRELPLACVKAVTVSERTPVSKQREIFRRLQDTTVRMSMALVSPNHYGFLEDMIKLSQPVSIMPPFVSPRTAHIFSERQDVLGQTARWQLQRAARMGGIGIPI